MKKKKKLQEGQSPEWIKMTPEERSKVMSDYLARTPTRDLFPKDYKAGRFEWLF